MYCTCMYICILSLNSFRMNYFKLENKSEYICIYVSYNVFHTGYQLLKFVYNMPCFYHYFSDKLFSYSDFIMILNNNIFSAQPQNFAALLS